MPRHYSIQTFSLETRGRPSNRLGHVLEHCPLLIKGVEGSHYVQRLIVMLLTTSSVDITQLSTQ